MKTKSISIYYIPFPDKESAQKCSEVLLNGRLAACTQIIPAASGFLWSGKMEHVDEFILIAKTAKTKSKELGIAVSKIHPYDLPCIAHWNIRVNIDYARWVKSSVEND